MGRKRINWVLAQFELKERLCEDLPAAYGGYSRPPANIARIKMKWKMDHPEPDSRKEYITYIRAVLGAIGGSHLASDVGYNCKVLDMLDESLPCKFRGTTDVIIHKGGLTNDLATARIISQMKKDPQNRHEAQSYAELLSGSYKANKQVFALLTDFCNVWEYMWLTLEPTSDGTDEVAYLNRVKFDKFRGLSALLRILAFEVSGPLPTVCATTAAIIGAKRKRDEVAAEANKRQRETAG